MVERGHLTGWENTPIQNAHSRACAPEFSVLTAQAGSRQRAEGFRAF
jgi:hypothetical protein